MKTIFYIKREKDVTQTLSLSFTSAMHDFDSFPPALKYHIFAHSLSKSFSVFVS